MNCAGCASLWRKKNHFPCLFWTSTLLTVGGLALIITAVSANFDKDVSQGEGWLVFGCIAGSIFLIFGLGFFLILWHFGKTRDERQILDYETGGYDKRVPKSIEAKMEENKRKNKEREMEEEVRQKQRTELERKATMQSNRTVQTILPGSRVTSQESANTTNFQPIFENGDDFSFQNRAYSNDDG